MNDRALSGVIMVSAAGLIAWAWLTGRLDKQIQQVVGRAKSSVHPATAAVRGESAFGEGHAGGGAAGGGGHAW